MVVIFHLRVTVLLKECEPVFMVISFVFIKKRWTRLQIE